MFNTNRIQLLQKKSENALGIFRKSILDLEEANKELSFEKAKELELKARIDEKLASLDKLEQENSKFINKISQIFED